VTFPLRHEAALPAVRRCPQAGPGASARQPAGKLPSASATKALQLKPRCSPAAHGCKAPSINARTVRPATWPSNGAMTAHDPANAWALVVSVHAARRWSLSRNSPKTPSRANPCPRSARLSII